MAQATEIPANAKELLEGQRNRLISTRDGLREDAAVDLDAQGNLGELSAVDQHPADAGTETFEREKDLAILEQVEEQIVEVEAALGRLEAGEYGKCEACGNPIGRDRLEAIPQARFCVEHQAAAEQAAS